MLGYSEPLKAETEKAFWEMKWLLWMMKIINNLHDKKTLIILMWWNMDVSAKLNWFLFFSPS